MIFSSLLESLKTRAAPLIGGLFAALAIFFGTIQAHSAPTLLPAPIDSPILTISGKISASNRDGQAVFDRAMLEALGAEKITTSTPWHDGPQLFEGVSFEKLLQKVGATGDSIEVIALNNYVVHIPRADLAKYNVILAMKRNGKTMSVRDNGPLFVIYPFDAHPEIATETYYARCAWQLAQIVVK